MLPFILITHFLLYCGSAFQPVSIGGHHANRVCMDFSQRRSADDGDVAAPVYITIGPPCSGKTEALRAHLLSDGYNPDNVFSRDVALDEQSSVYHRVPLAAFLFPSTHLDPTSGQHLLKSGSTVQDRLLDPAYDRTDQEIRNVMLRMAGRITPHEFANRTLTLAAQAGDTVKFFQKRRMAVAHDLMAAVEHVVVQAVSEVICQMQLQQQQKEEEQHSNDELPYAEDEAQREDENTIDLSTLNATQAHLLSTRALIKTPHVELFVPQAIFHGGIDRAEEALTRLLRSSRHAPVSWGNTNTRPTQYAAALSAAEETGRPVKFVAWGTSRLPAVSRQELLRRNVASFRNTGRYIPAGAISAALGRVESLVKDAQQQVPELFLDEPCPPVVQPGEWENHKMDVAFASLAGFRMDKEGFVVQDDQPKSLRRQKSVRGDKPKRLLSSYSGEMCRRRRKQ